MYKRQALDAQYLKEKAAEYGLKGSVNNSVSSAFEKAKENAKENDMIYVGGSTFVVAEIL